MNIHKTVQMPQQRISQRSKGEPSGTIVATRRKFLFFLVCLHNHYLLQPLGILKRQFYRWENCCTRDWMSCSRLDRLLTWSTFLYGIDSLHHWWSLCTIQVVWGLFTNFMYMLDLLLSQAHLASGTSVPNHPSALKGWHHFRGSCISHYFPSRINHQLCTPVSCPFNHLFSSCFWFVLWPL